MYDDFYFKEMKLKDKFAFTCTHCAECCKNVHQSVSLSSLDIYNLAKHMDISILDVCNNYMDIIWVNEYLPVYVLKTIGTEDRCVFLRGSDCQVHGAAKPYVCRIYPLGALPHDKQNKLIYGIVSEKEHHFTGDEFSIIEWVTENMSSEQKDVLLHELKVTVQLGAYLKSAHIMKDEASALFHYLYFKYHSYDFHRPYLPQFKSNMAQLLKLFQSKYGKL